MKNWYSRNVELAQGQRQPSVLQNHPRTIVNMKNWYSRNVDLALLAIRPIGCSGKVEEVKS